MAADDLQAMLFFASIRFHCGAESDAYFDTLSAVGAHKMVLGRALEHLKSNRGLGVMRHGDIFTIPASRQYSVQGKRQVPEWPQDG